MRQGMVMVVVAEVGSEWWCGCGAWAGGLGGGESEGVK